MSIIVEDGTGLSTAESYISVATFKAYADAHGLSYGSVTDPEIEQALRRATAWLDATYGARFGGYRVAIDQALVFPRAGLFDREGYQVAFDSVPRQIAAATAEAAVREIASPGSLNPDVTPGAVKKRVRVEGAVEVEYAVGSGGAASQTPVVVQIIDGLLSMLLGNNGRSPYQGKAVRA